MINRVFFPLRSNVGWFQEPSLEQEISNRIKQAILLYDELVIEDGTFQASILEDGAVKNHFPPGTISEKSRTIEYERDIKESNITFTITPHTKEKKGNTGVLLHGRSSARYKVDYFQIFKDIDVSSYEFLKIITINQTKLPSEAKSLAKINSFNDRTAFKNLDTNPFLRDLVIESLNFDIVTSILLKSAIVLDSKHCELLYQKARRESKNVSSVNEEVVVRKLIEFAAPNFNDLSVEQVIKLRKDSLWSDFRNFVSCLINNLKDEPELLTNESAFSEAVHKQIHKSMFDELKKKYPSGWGLTLDVGFGLTSLIPGYGIIPTIASAAKSGYEHYKNKSGWFAFLMNLNKQ